MQSAALLDVDEAKEVLDRMDQKQVVAQQREILDAADSHCSFTKEYRARKQDLLAMARARSKTPAARGKAKANALPRSLSQQEAKRWIPPALASIRVPNTREPWCGHVPPFRRISTPWANFQTAARVAGLTHEDVGAALRASERSGDAKCTCTFDFDSVVASLAGSHGGAVGQRVLGLIGHSAP